MSRVAKAPIPLPDGIKCVVNDGQVQVSGDKTTLSFDLPAEVGVEVEEGFARAVPKGRRANTALTGTVRSVLDNFVTGIANGFERRLQLVGVGYRVQSSGNKLTFSLGLSHPVVYDVPSDISVQTPSATEIVLNGADKRAVGQVAANIRAFRPPEPYKGKGIRFAEEHVILKDPKKK